MNEQELKNEIRFSLPSKRMTDYPNASAVINPYNGKLVILKCRYEKIVEDKLTFGDFKIYRENHDPLYGYRELLGKNIIFDSRLLSKRGIKALKELAV